MTTKVKNNLDLGGFQVRNVGSPTADDHAATRGWVNTQLVGMNGYTDEEARDAIAAALTAGTNITITPNDAGDTITIAVSGLGALATLSTVGTAQITDDAVTYAKLQDITATQRVLGRGTAGAGNAEELTVGGGIEFDGTALRTSAFTGDVTKTAGGTATTIADAAVTNAKMANMANATVKGRNTAGTGVPEDITMTQLRTLLALTAANISDFSTAADARVTAVVTAAFINALAGVDADTLGGSTKAQVVTEAIAGVVDSAPGTLDTLNELAAALGDDPNFATTITTALDLRTQKYAADIGDGAATTIAVNHARNTRDVSVTVYDKTTWEEVLVDVVHTDVNNVHITFGAAPALNAYRVVVIG